VPRACGHCSRPAEFSLRFHLATVARSPRRNASLRGISLCSNCLERLILRLSMTVPAQLIEPLRAAHKDFSFTAPRKEPT
jgi:hypothetical protein